MTHAERMRRTRLNSGDRREQILQVAQSLFAERAYEEVSTSELAAAAGTTRTNLHHHFGTKRALYLEVVRRFARLPTPPAMVEVTGGSPEAIAAAVNQTFDRWLDLVEHNRATYLSMIGATSIRRDPEVEAVLQAGMSVWEERLLAVLRAPRTDINRAQVRAFQALLSTATDEWLRLGTLDRCDVHNLLTSTLLALPTQPHNAS
ncbi:TetR/AcrR family transcriptional regulator [Gordonia sp. C13]|uniref:TetR/AcrR family transcriptional regulator n=1 Tax=Gordonia sp. C13 TaxID=2935078 RepID=UPI00200B13E5|nr:TetR/AcrR family transcriptional regulator [Gordonia sp. C13]MCK8616699.1 TetR/AcrR family transcriptional regulator [Gordonia sp. C13]